MKFSMMPQTVGMLKFMLIFFKYYSRERTLLAWVGEIYSNHNYVLFWDTCKPIGFELVMMLSTTELQLDSCLNDLDVHSRSQSYRKAGTGG